MSNTTNIFDLPVDPAGGSGGSGGPVQSMSLNANEVRPVQQQPSSNTNGPQPLDQNTINHIVSGINRQVVRGQHNYHHATCYIYQSHCARCADSGKLCATSPSAT